MPFSTKLYKENIVLTSYLLSGVTFGIGNLDSIPWHLLAIIVFGRNIYKLLDLAIFSMVLSIIAATALIDQENFQNSLFIRQLGNYLSVVIGGAYLISNPPTLSRLLKVILFVLIINIIVGILQIYFVNLTFFSHARFDTLGERGTVGLFSEPTAFGLFSVFCFLFGCFMIIETDEKQLKTICTSIILLALFSILFVNKSSAALLIVVLSTAVFTLRKPKYIFYFLIITICIWLYFLYFPNARISRIIGILAYKDIWYLIAVDGSINERLSAVIGPYFGWFSNNLFPSSAFGYYNVFLALVEATDYFFWWGGGAKIMNYLGTVVYEMSFLGLLIIYRYIFKNLQVLKSFVLVFPALIYLSNSVPLSHGYPLLLFAGVCSQVCRK